MMKLHGAELASFRGRASAFLLDFLLAAVLFTGLVALGSSLATIVGIRVGDVHLTFDFTHWYTLVFLVVYFTLRDRRNELRSSLKLIGELSS